MSKTNKILAGLAAAQVVLVIVSWSFAGRISGARDSALLIDGLDAESVTSLSITAPAKDDGAETTLTLEKRGDDWVVATADGYPAKKDKVEELVGKIVGLKTREPVATNKANHSVLKVADDNFEKKVALKAGDREIDLVVGGGKGSSIHARFAGKDEVFLARGVNAFALSERPSTYVDTQYIKVENPTSVVVKNPKGSLNLTMTEAGGWTVAELPGDADVDSSRVDAFVSSARSVMLAEPVGKEVKPEYGLDGGTRVELTNSIGTTAYTVGAEADGKRYVKADDNEFVVKVSKWAVNTLVEQVPNKFIKEAAAPAPPPGGGMPGGGMPGGGQIPPELLKQLMQQQQQRQGQ